MSRNYEYEPEEAVERPSRRRRSRRGGRLFKRLGLILALAAAFVVADIASPYIKQWLWNYLPHINYQETATQLTHEMAKVGELISLRSTDTGIMTGEIKAKLLGTVSTVNAPYLYEIGLGVSLEDVALTPEETRLVVAVPEAKIIYDHFEVTGAPENQDFWGMATQQRYQAMVDQRQEACRQMYLDDPEYMTQAWDSACEQLRALFAQWTGEDLQLEFIPLQQAPEGGQ